MKYQKELNLSVGLCRHSLATNGWRYVFVADFEALHCQGTLKFIRCRNAETPTILAIKYTACYAFGLFCH